MRIVVLLLNVALLVIVVCSLVDHGFPPYGHHDFWFALVLVAAPIPTIVLVCFDATREPATWFGLWVRRKTAEERVRLRQAEESAAGTPPTAR